MLLADCNSVIGCISPPPGVTPLPQGGDLGPIIGILNLFLKLVFIAAGLFALFNFIIAGFGFMTAGGDAKQVSAAWNKIQMSFLGLIVIVSSFLLAAILGQILFGDATYFLKPQLTLQ